MPRDHLSSPELTNRLERSECAEPCCRGGSSPRLNLLLSWPGWASRPRPSALEQLPSLLSPMGIHSITAGSGEEAADVIKRYTVHIAVVDLAVPMQRPSAANASRLTSLAEGGPRILQLLRRNEPPPPTVVIRPPQPVNRESTRSLAQALREGAFAVLDQPVELESLLEVLRRILRRHYGNAWPA